jgi:hypothetical protein
MDPHSIGRPDPDPGGLKRTKMKKKRSKKPDNQVIKAVFRIRIGFMRIRIQHFF